MQTFILSTQCLGLAFRREPPRMVGGLPRGLGRSPSFTISPIATRPGRDSAGRGKVEFLAQRPSGFALDMAAHNLELCLKVILSTFSGHQRTLPT